MPYPMVMMKMERLDVRSENVGQQTYAAERDAEDDSEDHSDEEPEGRFLESGRDLKPERSLRCAVLDPRPELARDAGRSPVEERVDEKAVLVGRVNRCSDLPGSEDDDGEGDAQPVDQQPAVGPIARTGAIGARRLGADDSATRRCA